MISHNSFNTIIHTVYSTAIFLFFCSFFYLVFFVNNFLLFILYTEISVASCIIIFVVASAYYGSGIIEVFAISVLVLAAVESAIGLSLAVSHTKLGKDLFFDKIGFSTDLLNFYKR